MFPKNMTIYRVNCDFNIEKLERQLEEFKLLPLGSQDKQKFGWVSALPKAQMFTHLSGGHILIRSCKQEKLLPAACINKLVKEKVDYMEAQEGRPLKKAEKDDIRDDVVMDKLPTAFIKETFTNVFIFPADGLIVVDTSTHKKAEDTLALLRKSMGSIPCIPLIPQIAVETTLTEWVKTGDVPSGYEIGNAADMKSILDDGGTVKLKNNELTSDAVHQHIEENKMVIALELSWQDRISFVLKENMQLSRVNFGDVITDQNEDIPREDVHARMDADFSLAAGEMLALIKSLIDVLGGLDEEMIKHEQREDSLLNDAIAFVKETRRASVSALQRKFKIGYNHAARIMESMEAMNVVSKPAHNGNREVLAPPIA